MSEVDYGDIQGMLRFGFGKMPEARYYLLRIREAGAARAWLRTAPVTKAETKSPPPAQALQVAFTASGLRKLGVREQIVMGFSPEFTGGMTEEANRSRRLGDVEENDPGRWWWGGPGDEIDLLVMLFTVHGAMDSWAGTVCNAAWSDAFDARPSLGTSDLDGREPFGFIDGISQPELDWERRRNAGGDQLDYTNRVALGEFLLGYPNEYGKYTDRPLLDPSYENSDLLAPAENDPGMRDLARNGSYLVMRQLEQDVRGFWDFVNGASGALSGKALAEALVGRRLDDGAPLAPLSTGVIEGVRVAHGEPENRFTYSGDPAGTRCPFGAHIRRANPRNTDLPGRPASLLARTWTMLGGGAGALRDDLMASTRFHRILRRGREYGQPGKGEATGLHFVCLNANISRQFEFVQNAWIQSGKFNGLPDESDPLLGPAGGRFSIPREGLCPVRVTGIPRFITVRGGAYFFLPGLRALRYFASPAR